MRALAQPRRVLVQFLSWIGAALWVGAGFSYFFLALGRPPRVFGLVLAALLGVSGILAFAGVALIARRARRAVAAPQLALDPAKQAALRRSIKWTATGCLALLVGLAWALFAVNEWSGSRGGLLAASGVMITAGISFAASLPYIRAVEVRRRPFGMSYVGFTYVSVIVAFGCALLVAILAIGLPTAA